MEIRPLEPDDLPGVVPLLSQLGYPTDGESLAARMELLDDDPHVKIWVAVEGNGKIVGLLSGHLSHNIELDGPVARLTALVTDESVRGKRTRTAANGPVRGVGEIVWGSEGRVVLG